MARTRAASPQAAPAGAENGTRRRGIQSVETGLRVLAALGACGGPAPLSMVAQRAALSASQAHRYLASLLAAGMAKQDSRTGLYDLDAGAIRLGLSALARLDIFARADAAFADFATATGRTILLAVWGDAGATVVRWFAGNPPVITSLALGSVLPLLHSATGRLFLAWGDPAAMDGAAIAAGANEADLPALRRQVRAALTTCVSGSVIPGLRAIAAPVFDLQGRLALAATVLAHDAFDPADDARIATALTDTCREVTQALGGAWPEPPAG
jgi:DNA-binding IclR family transcriptional regulator